VSTPVAVEEEVLSPRKPWLAVLLSVLCPGLGLLYAGAGRLALILVPLHLLLAPALMLLWAALPQSIRPLVVAPQLAALTLYLAIVALSWRAARRARPAPPEPYQAVPAYGIFAVAVTLGGSLIMGALVHDRAVFNAYVEGDALAPQLLDGDSVLVRRLGDSAQPRKGAIAALNPEGPQAQKAELVRVLALAGEQVEGTTVPDGHLYAQGKGLVKLERYLGEAKAIYHSMGPQGRRWGRIGQAIQ
jgi:hypothetical protein